MPITIVVDGKSININDYNELLDFLLTAPKQEDLFQLMAQAERILSLISSNYQLEKILKTLPDSWQIQLLFLVMDNEQSQKLVSNWWEMELLLNILSIDVIETVLNKILTETNKFYLFFPTHHTLTSSIKSLCKQEKLQPLVGKFLHNIFSRSEYLHHFFLNWHNVIYTLKDMNEENQQLLLQYICNQQNFLWMSKNAEYNYFSLRLVLCIFPQKFSLRILEIFLSKENEDILKKYIPNEHAFYSFLAHSPSIYEKKVHWHPAYGKKIIEHIMNNTAMIKDFFSKLSDLLKFINSLPDYYETIIDSLFRNNELTSIYFANKKNLFFTINKMHIDKKIGKKLTEKLTDYYQENLLSIAMTREKYSIIPKLLEWGEDPNSFFAEQPLLHFFLKKDCKNYAVIKKLLIQGADPSIEHEGLNALDVLMLAPNFIEYDEQMVVLFLLNGAISHLQNKDDKNILQIVYKIFPNIKHYVNNHINNTQQTIFQNIYKTFIIIKNYVSESISIDDMENTTQVLTATSLPSFIFAIKNEIKLLQARSEFLNFLICISLFDRKHNTEISLHPILKFPDELLVKIFSYLDLAKTEDECLALMRFMLQNKQELETMLKSSGGINVLQTNLYSNHDQNKPKISYSFQFFKSSMVVAHDCQEKKKQLTDHLRKTQNRRHFIWDWLANKEFTNTSIQTLNSDRQNKLNQITLFQHESQYSIEKINDKRILERYKLSLSKE